jgi:hypothetical protein
MTNSAWVTVGDGDVVEALGTGTLIIIKDGKEVVLEDVLYVPELYCNVISVSALTEKDFTVVFSKFSAEVKQGAEVLLRAVKSDGLYLIDIAKHKSKWFTHVMHSSCFSAQGSATPTHASHDHDTHMMSTTESAASDALLWHNRLGHPSQGMTKLICESVQGVPAYDKLASSFKVPCHDCLAGRFTAVPRNKLADRPTDKCALIYADVVGPYVKGINKSTVCLNVIDAYTGYAISTPMKDKSYVCENLIDSIKRLQMLSHCKVMELRTDNDSVFHSSKLID